MGQRALVAYERNDGGYDLHYSHWGAERFALVWSITPRTPFGGDGNTERNRGLHDRLAADCDVEASGGYLADAPDTAVDPHPVATGLGFDAILAEYLDFEGYEAFYVVTAGYEVRAYLPVSFGRTKAGDAADARPRGALLGVRDATDATYLRGWFRGTEEVLGELVDRGVLSEREALERLVRAVVERAGGEREVMLSTGRDA